MAFVAIVITGVIGVRQQWPFLTYRQKEKKIQILIEGGVTVLFGVGMIIVLLNR